MCKPCFHMAFLRTAIVLAFFCLRPDAAAQDSNTYEKVTIEEIPPLDTILTETNGTTDTGTRFDPLPGGAGIVHARQVPDSAVRNLMQDEAFWYANLAPQREQPKKGRDPNRLTWMDKAWVKTLAWIIVIGGFLAVLGWYLASSNIRLFRTSSSRISEEESMADEENIFSLDYEAELRKALAEANYRQAVRLWYLRTLRDLSEREIIDYQQGRTNSDYLAQLHGTAYHKDFFRLTRNFEYAWYGQFDLSPASYDMIQKDFSHFNQRMPS